MQCLVKIGGMSQSPTNLPHPPSIPDTSAPIGRTSSRSRLWLVLGCVVAVFVGGAVLIFVVAIGQQAVMEANRSDSPELFADLADGLLDQPDIAGHEIPDLDTAQLIGALRHNQRIMEDLAGSTLTLAPIAESHVKNIAAIREIIDPEIAKGPTPSMGLFAVAVVRAVGGAALGSPGMVQEGTNEGLDEVKKGVGVRDAITSALQRVRASQWELGLRASQFSSAHSQGHLLTAKFTTLPAEPFKLFGDSLPARIDPSHVMLTNSSGVELHNVLVVMTIRPAKVGAKAWRQVVWLRSWPVDQVRRAKLKPELPWYEVDMPTPASADITVWTRDRSSAEESFKASIELPATRKK